MDKIAAGCLVILFVLAVAVAIGGVVAYAFHLLWNYVAPPVFGLPEVTFFQAWAIIGILGIIGGLFRTTVSK